MSNLTGQVASATSGLLEKNMANVIDDLKRLERLGSEHSETTRKIIDAARNLGEKIVSLYPVENGDDFQICPDDLNYRIVRIGRGRQLLNGAINELVYGSRRAALCFAEDIAGGLLIQIERDLQKRLAADKNALPALLAAAESIEQKLQPDMGLHARAIMWKHGQDVRQIDANAIRYRIEGLPIELYGYVTRDGQGWRYELEPGDGSTQTVSKDLFESVMGALAGVQKWLAAQDVKADNPARH